MKRLKILYRRLVFIMLIGLFALPGTAKDKDKPLSYDAALRKAIYYARVRNYKRALKYFKLSITANPASIDPYFNAANIARHFNNCRDQLLYFRGFIYLSVQFGSADRDIKTAKSAIRRCKRDPKVGTLNITTQTPGLEVTVDGALVGKTPIKGLPLMEGTYTYGIKNPLFEPFSAQVKIKAKETTDLQPQLVKRTFYGWLQITTTPKKGVHVTLAGKDIGVTPLKKLRLKTGKYLVVLKADGYDTWQRYVEIAKDQTATLDATLQKPVKRKKLDMERWKKFEGQ